MKHGVLPSPRSIQSGPVRARERPRVPNAHPASFNAAAEDKKGFCTTVVHEHDRQDRQAWSGPGGAPAYVHALLYGTDRMSCVLDVRAYDLVIAHHVRTPLADT